jgi:nitroreductase
MELTEVMRTTGHCRFYRPDPVPDEVFYRAIEAARFAPQGGNRQGVRFVIVRDAERKRRLGELYLPEWKQVYDAVRSGAASISSDSGVEKTTRLGFSNVERQLRETNEFAERFGEHPAIVVVCVDPAETHPTDVDLDRLSIVGGASVYPMAQNFLLALRDLGVATAFTTLLVAREPEVRELLDIPEQFITACHIVAGYPARGFPTRLRRRAVEEIAFVDRFGEPLRAKVHSADGADPDG